MRSCGRCLRGFQWVCAGGSGIIAVLWLISLFAAPTVRWQHAAGKTAVVVRHGKVALLAVEATPPWSAEDAAIVDRWTDLLKQSLADDQGFVWPHTRFLDLSHNYYAGYRLTVVPLWLPLLSLLAATSALWWLDRQRGRSGYCRCGYDLTGNVSGRCPECGAVTPACAKRPP